MKLIHNALICNEYHKYYGYITIQDQRIESIGHGVPSDETIERAIEKIDARGSLVMPGVIDDQVHFREPGMTHKGDIASESRAAVTGGVTSYMEMPNVNPATTTIELLEQKYARAAEVSPANYSFYMGATNSNIDEIARINPKNVCGVKLFMGSSTGNMLVDEADTLTNIFKNSPVLIATHCEQEEIVRANMQAAIARFGDNVPIEMHPVIRSAEACYASSAKAVELAVRHNARLHVLHLSTARELKLFESKPLAKKKITNEVCVHHLWFTDEDYAKKGNFIKWNPAIKSRSDRDALREAVNSSRVDIVATDHAPHTLAEKSKPYLQAPSGGPLVQHSLTAMLEMVSQGHFSIEKVVDVMCHRPAELFRVEKRGFLREGYFADIAIVNLEHPWVVSPSNILYKCGWSPFEGQLFGAKVTHTLVNGELAYADGTVNDSTRGLRLTFTR